MKNNYSIMAVKKAISSIDLLIQEKKDFRTKIVGSELPPLIQGDFINRFDRAMWSMLQGDIEWLQAIKDNFCLINIEQR